MGATGGVVVGQIVSLEEIFGSSDLWQFALSCFAVIVIICLMPYGWMPESPKYLYCIAKRRDFAEEEIIRLRGNDDTVRSEIESMNPRGDETGDKRTMCSVVKDPKLILPVTLTCALTGGQQLSGINAVFFYSVALFESVGLTKKQAQWANLGAGSINLLVAFFSPVLMSKVNRRPLALLSISMASVMLFCIMFSLILIVS